mmetsp:Transcript_18870/g.56438  ORF Transcript_18870/g.56438 Transcript_18870/m.56438 type:complete len:200 (+) Transcript_18870:134-733(+)
MAIAARALPRHGRSAPGHVGSGHARAARSPQTLEPRHRDSSTAAPPEGATLGVRAHTWPLLGTASPWPGPTGAWASWLARAGTNRRHPRWSPTRCGSAAVWGRRRPAQGLRQATRRRGGRPLARACALRRPWPRGQHEAPPAPTRPPFAAPRCSRENPARSARNQPGAAPGATGGAWRGRRGAASRASAAPAARRPVGR